MKTKKTLLLLTVLLFSFLVLQNGCKKDPDDKPIPPPPPSPSSNTFDVIFGDERIDIAYSIQETSDGDYIIAGKTGPTYIIHDARIIKLDSTGNLIWDKIYKSGISYAWSIKETSDGGFIITGQCSGGGTFLWLFKINLHGEVIWEQKYGGTSGGYMIGNCGRDVKQTSDGGFIIVGSTITYAYAGWEDIWVIKTDPEGIIEWETIIGDGGKDNPHSVDIAPDGGFIITATTRSSMWGTNPKGQLIKLEPNGDLSWMYHFQGASSAKTTKDECFIVTGGSRLYKVNNEGNMIWEKEISYGSVELNLTKDDGYILIGHYFQLTKTDSIGNIIWEKPCDYSGARAYSGHQTADCGYIMTGDIQSETTGADFLIIKTDSLGNQ